MKLCIGRQYNDPWPEVSDAAVDSCVEFIRGSQDA